MQAAGLFDGAEHFPPELLSCFDARRLLPFDELALKLLVLKSRAFFPAPLQAWKGKCPAVIIQIQRTAMTFPDRFWARFHN